MRSEPAPLVSIVTPSFNQARFLEQTINSVLSQDYPPLEYIVVDGGSSDGSQEIIRKYASRLAWWCSEPDSGQTDALNKGFSHAKGAILAWLNSDDTYEPGAIKAAVQELQDNPLAGMVYGAADYIDAEGRKVGRFPAAQTDYARLRRGYVHVPQQAAFFRAALWHKVGPLDPSYYFAMDYDLWIRIARLSPLVYVPQVWANFRLHTASKTIDADDRCWPEMMRIHYRDGGQPLAMITARYLARRLLSPIINWRRRRLLRASTTRESSSE